MQSSTVMALRTLVMLASLLAVPLAAVFGTGSWSRVEELIDQWRIKLAAQLDPNRVATSSDSALTPIAPLAGPPIAPLTAAEASQPAAVAPPAAALSEVTLPATATAAEVPPIAPPSQAAAEPPAASEGPAAVNSSPLPPKPPFWPEPTPTATTDAGSPDPAASPTRIDPQVQPAVYVAEAEPASPVPPPDSPDRMGWIQHRLQTLGAAFYRLETAGSAGEMFRFHCKMTSRTNPNYVRYFEATSSEPLRAMQHVLDQVDAWMTKGESLRR
jgi:hypothetical protein